MAAERPTINIESASLEQRVRQTLSRAGASAESAAAATRAMMHASLVGVDSHGVRLTAHYCRMLEGGRINRTPKLAIEKRNAASAMLSGDDGLGHFAAYHAMALACEMAKDAGIGAVGIRHSSHFGAAGAYAMAAAEAGCIGFATTNTDSTVTLHGGAKPFHGTNPLAFAAPSTGGRPWLLDLATSSIPLNRVLLHRSLGKALPEGVAADANGEATTDANRAEMLLPLGGTQYGYKGAGLAGVATLLSAVLTGTTLDTDFIPMYDANDNSTPRNMGHFVLAIDPDKFVGRAAFDAALAFYLSALRGMEARPGERVMAPGDREWAEQSRRERGGIPIDPDTATFLGF